jgi:thioredoxin 1
MPPASAHTAVSVATDATLPSALAPGSGLVAIEFTADWCPPCRVMAPIIHDVATAYAPALRVMQVDADANPVSMTRFGVRGLPTMLVFRDGQLVDRIVGSVSKAVLVERLQRQLVP